MNILSCSSMEQHHQQLDFFVCETPISRVTQRIECLSVTVNKVRKSLFAANGELSKAFLSHQIELDSLKLEMSQMRKLVRELKDQLDVLKPNNMLTV